MDDNKVIIALRNFVIIGFFHLLQLIACIWVSGVCIAYFTNEFHLIGLNDNAIEVAYKWGKWLFSVWSQLPYNGYEYLKVKLTLSLIVPFLISCILYYKYFDKIKAWRPYKTKEKVYGDARWATPEDINRAGLRSKHGMLLGTDKSGYYVADGFQHALLFAPTGSGKGVGFVIPNLLFWEHSVVVHDIKLENHELTSGWRAKQGQEVFVWEPTNPDGKTHCYNPIDWVSHKPGQMVDDVQKISNLIMPEKDFWNNEARSLFVGVVLYLIADPSKPNTFGEVVRTMRSDDVVYNLAVVLDTLGKVIHPVAYMNLAAFLQKADKERSGVISTMNSSLELWANPLIDAATASSDFNIQEFKKKKTTVYVGLTPDNITRLQKLMQVFYQQATEFLSRKMPDLKEEPYGVMFLMDEFPTLGKMEQFKTGIAYFRGYRVRLFLIIQDTQQLKGTYEEAGMNSFLSNSTYRITFAANNYETANLISQLCGNKTVQQTSQSKPKFFDLNPATRTVNISEVQRALLLPQEVIQLPRDEQIVLIESFPPIKSNKIKYFDDKFFTKRLLPPTFIPIQEPYDARKTFENEASDDEELIEEEFEEEIEELEENYESSEEEIDDVEEDESQNDEDIEEDEVEEDEESEVALAEEKSHLSDDRNDDEYDREAYKEFIEEDIEDSIKEHHTNEGSKEQALENETKDRNVEESLEKSEKKLKDEETIEENTLEEHLVIKEDIEEEFPNDSQHSLKEEPTEVNQEPIKGDISGPNQVTEEDDEETQLKELSTEPQEATTFAETGALVPDSPESQLVTEPTLSESELAKEDEVIKSAEEGNEAAVPETLTDEVPVNPKLPEHPNTQSVNQESLTHLSSNIEETLQSLEQAYNVDDITQESPNKQESVTQDDVLTPQKSKTRKPRAKRKVDTTDINNGDPENSEEPKNTS